MDDFFEELEIPLNIETFEKPELLNRKIEE